VTGPRKTDAEPHRCPELARGPGRLERARPGRAGAGRGGPGRAGPGRPCPRD